MANVKISQLPEYSGNPTGGYSVYNNSGETATYKIKNQNLFGDTNIIGSAAKYPFVVGSGNTLNNILQVAIGYGNNMVGGENRDGGLNANMVVGNNNSITDTYTSNVLIVGQNNTNGGWNSVVIGQNNNVGYGLDGMVVGNSNTSGTEYSYVFGQSNNTSSQGGFIVGQGHTAQGYAISFEAPFLHGFNHTTIMSHAVAMVGGRYNQIIGIMYDTTARPYYDAIVGGEYNYIGTYITGSTIVGSGYSTITGTSGTTKYSVINGGSGNTISSSSYSSIQGGTSNNITGGINNGILGGQGNTNSSTRGTILGGINNQHSGTNGVVLGGEGNNATGWIASVGGYNNTASAEIGFVYGNQCIGQGQTIGIVGAEHGRTLGSTYRSFIGGGLYNWMTNATNSVMLGGMNNTITGGTNVAMIGTSGRTADADNTTYVENLHTYRTPSTEVQPVVSGSVFTCNIELGAKSQFYITGTSTINITNVRDGASFMVKTQTDGNYVMTWTATGGYTFKFDDGGQNPGNNTIDIWAFEVFGNVIYGSRRHNFV